MKRLRFMEAGGSARTRIECYLLAPKFKMDKDRNRVVTLIFSVKMNADLALVCDDKIKRAWEDCEDLEREITRVVLKSEVEHTNIAFFELPESKSNFFSLENVTLESLMIERNDGQTYLYFAANLFLHKSGLGKFTLERYGTALFAEFTRSQLAMPLDVAAKSAAGSK